MFPYVIRTASPSDAEAIAAIHVASWQETYRGLIDDAVLDSRTVERRLALWSEALNDSRRTTFVAWSQGAVWGFASAVIEYDSSLQPRGYLQMLYVLRAAQGSGIGEALLRAAALALSSQGCHALRLHVLANNVGARGFYEHLGGRYLHDCNHTDGDDQWLDAVYEWSNLASLTAPRND